MSFFFFQAEDGIRDIGVTGVQTCALPISDGGDFKWGVTITTAYLPLDNTKFFETDKNLVEWLSQYGVGNEVLMKGFLGRMLFKQEEVEKKVNVDRKSTRLNSSHANISYAVFCL